MWGRSKYGNKKVEHAGRSFASKLEASGFDMIQNRKDIKLRRQQAHIKLSKADILYIADFECDDLTSNIQDALRYIETKGFETPEWKLKKRLYRIYGKWPLEIWIRKGKGIFLDEIIYPQREQ